MDKNSMVKTGLSYNADAVHSHDRDRFYTSLFVAQPAREALLALYALNVEMAHVHRAVTEEMLGHIRYAWWQEGLEAIASNQSARQHPLLQSLSPENARDYLPLVVAYREQFPQMPPGGDDVVDMLSIELLKKHAPESEAGWRKANRIIFKHRQRFGSKANNWLRIKLLMAGVF